MHAHLLRENGHVASHLALPARSPRFLIFICPHINGKWDVPSWFAFQVIERDKKSYMPNPLPKLYTMVFPGHYFKEKLMESSGQRIVVSWPKSFMVTWFQKVEVTGQVNRVQTSIGTKGSHLHLAVFQQVTDLSAGNICIQFVDQTSVWSMHCPSK